MIPGEGKALSLFLSLDLTVPFISTMLVMSVTNTLRNLYGVDFLLVMGYHKIHKLLENHNETTTTIKPLS